MSTRVSLSAEGPTGTPFSTARTTRRPKPVRAVLCTQHVTCQVAYTAQHGQVWVERLQCIGSLRERHSTQQCGTTFLERDAVCARMCLRAHARMASRPLRRYCMRSEAAQHSTECVGVGSQHTETPRCVRIAPALSAGCGSMLAPGTCGSADETKAEPNRT